MSRRFVFAAALALACAAPVPAAATSYFYTIHHLANPFYRMAPDQPEFADFTGLFEGTDRNGDHVIGLSELTLFVVGSLRNNVGQLLPSVEGSEWLCIPDNSPTQCITHSHLDLFSYDLSSGAFEAKGANPSWPDGSLIETGNAVGFNAPASSVDAIYLWTPQTYVTVRPVPEPGTWALLAAGLLGLGAGRKLLRRGSCSVLRPTAG